MALVMGSRVMDLGSGGGWPFRWRGVPAGRLAAVCRGGGDVGFGGGGRTAGVTGLEDVQGPAHIAFA